MHHRPRNQASPPHPQLCGVARGPPRPLPPYLAPLPAPQLAVRPQLLVSRFVPGHRAHHAHQRARRARGRDVGTDQQRRGGRGEAGEEVDGEEREVALGTG